jgi:hypothetical protein
MSQRKPPARQNRTGGFLIGSNIHALGAAAIIDQNSGLGQETGLSG